MVERAAAYPLFTPDSDPESGLEALSWTTGAWTELNLRTAPAVRERELRTGLAEVLDSGRNALVLGLLLELGEIDRAERIVRDNFRLFLMFTGPQAVEQLTSLRPDPPVWPALALLQVEVGSRGDGGSQDGRDVAAAAMTALQEARPTSFADEMTRTVLCLFAAVSAGERARANRLLDHALELLAERESIAVHGLADAQRPRRVGQLYLAYWSSLQLDRHSDSLALAGLMVDLSDPADRLYVVESVSLTTEQDLAGLRSLSDEPIEESIPSHAAAFRLIEEGRDAEALAGLRPFIERSGPKQSRSAIDALVLLVRAQSDPAGLGSDEVRKVVRRSRRLWRDRRPSSFIAWAATVAVSIPGLEQGADALPEDPVGDGLFDALTRCARALRDGRHKEALAQCEGREELDFPRFEMIAGSTSLRRRSTSTIRTGPARSWRSAGGGCRRDACSGLRCGSFRQPPPSA